MPENVVHKRQIHFTLLTSIHNSTDELFNRHFASVLGIFFACDAFALTRLSKLDIHSPQNSVYKASGRRTPKGFREFYRFVDGYFRRHLCAIGIEKFCKPKSQYVPVYRRYLFKRPLRRRLYDYAVYLLLFRDCHRKQLRHERHVTFSRAKLFWVVRQTRLPFCGCHLLSCRITLEKNLEDDGAS